MVDSEHARAENVTGEASELSISRPLLLFFATAAGLAVASNYYAHPLLPMIGADLGLAQSTAALIVAVGQFGFTCGIVAVLPLADLVERRRLVVVVSAAAAGALLLFGLSGSAATLLSAAVAVGTVSVLGQLLTLTAVALVRDQDRGKVIGTITAGITLGILMARTVSGGLAELGGWRTVYLVAAIVMVGQAIALSRVLPRTQVVDAPSYLALLRSIPGLLLQERVLRVRALYGAATFASFNLMWTALVFLLAGDRFGYSAGQIGLFGLAGVVGSLLGSPIAGRLVDRGFGQAATGAVAMTMVISWLPLWLGGHQVVGLIVGVVLIDLGLQAMSVLNTAAILGLRPEARSRLQAAYLICYFVAGTAGSASAAILWRWFGWTGICVAGVCCAAVPVVLWLAGRVRGSRQDRSQAI